MYKIYFNYKLTYWKCNIIVKKIIGILGKGMIKT